MSQSNEQVLIEVINWELVNKKNVETIVDIIGENSNIIPWYQVSRIRGLPESFILKHKSKLDINVLITTTKLPQSFIEENFNKINQYSYYWLVRKQSLSEDFLKEHSDKFDWNHIARFQKLSFDFIKENFNKLPFKYIEMNKKIPIYKREIVKEIYRKFSDLL